MSRIKELKKKLISEFDMMDLSNAKLFLSMKIVSFRDGNGLCLKQPRYLDKLVGRFSMENCKPTNIPICANFVLSATLSLYHFIRDEISVGIVEVEIISTEENPADMGTKVVPYSKLKHCLNLLEIDDYG
ncbi:hypothetical protein LWI29_024972 [Acer saccharum]|uniref:Reverse transcriptase Ty1/copia-type domain-containing protein n=1 Tax=Acer saccharum TaxID=4024 RepID=A0AA39THW4_ACESA|nr:hypothetical protein LWI29_024972 [Acer saccharum]